MEKSASEKKGLETDKDVDMLLPEYSSAVSLLGSSDVAKRAPPAQHGSGWTLVLLSAGNLIIGGLGSLTTMKEVRGWYAGLVKPSFNPPSWVFGPVWTSLYLLSAYSMWRVWRSPGPHARATKMFYGAMMTINGIWTPLFFGLHRPDLALIDIALYNAVLSTWVRMLYAQDPTAAWLQAPHMAWVAFATLLNASIWWLNQ